MFENYVDVIEASRILGVHPETVKRLIREGKLTATKFGNKWIIERDRLQMFANTYDGRRGRVQALSLLRRHQELGLPEALLRVSYSEHPPLPRPGAAPTTLYYIIPTLPQAGEGFLRTNQGCVQLCLAS